ncbi:N-acetylglucosamine-1-phosphodiester alpha-N-acetylglucosaminidase-like [Saccostrea cucullata]|uniref:N-acetylglucosamine-1-phosphodiester alpha-N-acetylglucosaminidase-like n=1 Tax=Saccostrea cuccullata TaxID=36930 RepID=UPI002ED4A12C
MFGMNCSKHCPNGSYGALCRSKCNCKSSEICDAQIGCKGTLHSSEIKTQVVTDFTGSHENTTSLPLLSPVFYLSLTISLASIVICVLIGTTIYFAKRSKKGGWSVYACPLPSNSVTMQEPQQEDYTVILTNRAQQAY